MSTYSLILELPNSNNIVIELIQSYNQTITISEPNITHILGNTYCITFEADSGVYNYQIKQCGNQTNMIISNCSIVTTNCGRITSKPQVYASGIITLK